MEKKYPGRRAIGERVDEIENHRGQHAHIDKNHRCNEHEELEKITAMGAENFPETATRFGHDRMIALEHGLVHREIGDTAQEDDKNIHGFNIGQLDAIVIGGQKIPSAADRNYLVNHPENFVRMEERWAEVYGAVEKYASRLEGDDQMDVQLWVERMRAARQS